MNDNILMTSGVSVIFNPNPDSPCYCDDIGVGVIQRSFSF
ncbi:hypothetical protein PL9214290975 [Planktothrix tepida PCC 9214]|uniref:Uncharacterized protein n=1 Tax=Planktothrix tepida PCC 9214 TaxID=671072 RepID=A0A1J1LFZ9_9CYAN|nr:hypothetical protein PL9214290975 [Planktothrix tepida PCC 9214]